METTKDLKNHIIICNCSNKVKKIVEELQRSKRAHDYDIVLIIQDESLWRANPAWHPVCPRPEKFHEIIGSPADSSILTSINIKNASTAVILADPHHVQHADAFSALTAIAIERQQPGIHTIMELEQSENKLNLHTSEVNEFVCAGDITEKMISQSTMTPWVKNVFKHLLSTSEKTSQIMMCPIPRQYKNRSYRMLVTDLIEAGAPLTVCGFLLDTEKETEQDDQSATMSRDNRSRIVLNPRPGPKGKDSLLTHVTDLIIIANQQVDLNAYLAADSS
jgi:hypothetical protein